MAVMRYLRIGNDRYEIADEKLKVSEITSGITYYPILGSGIVNATSSRQWDSTGLQYDSFEGEEEGEGGSASLSLGNYIPVGETGSKRGTLILYGEEGSYSVLQSSTTGEGTGYYILLPDKQGTVALTDDIPTKLSQLENDSEFITEYTETDPTVSAWAKAKTKPTYTAQEVGAIGSVTVSRALVEGTKSATITVDGTSYDIYSKSGTITDIKTTAGAHTTVDVSSGAVSFNVPTTAAHVGIKFGYTTSGNNRAVLQDSSGNLYVTQKDDNTNTTYTLSGALSSHKFTSTLTAGGSGSGTSTSELTFVAGTGITLTDDATNKKITIAASHNGTVTSVAASGSGGITISGSPITTSGTITVGLNLSTAINGLSEGASPATINDYAVVQYAGGGTTTTTYHRRKLSNLIVGKAIADQNGDTINTTYLKLTGGSVTGPTTFGDTVSVNDLNAGQLVVSGSASVANNLQVNTINGVTVGSNPKFTDNNTTYSAGTGLSLSSTTFSLATSGATAGSYGPSANASPSHGGTFSVPYVTVDSYGRITAVSTKTITLPADSNTDTKVTQSATTTANWRKVLLHYKDDTATTTAVTSSTNQVYAAVGVSVQPSTGTLFATELETSTLTINKVTANTNTFADANPKIIFSNGGKSQNISLTFTDYDSVQSPASLTLNGDQGNEYFITPNLKIERAINHILKGTGTTASDKGSGVSPRYFPAKWTFNTGRTPADGDIIVIETPVAGHSYGVFISIDNGSHYHPVTLSGTGRLTTHWPAGSYVALIFDSNNSAADMYAVNGADARATVTGGTWRSFNYYTDGNTVPQAYCSTAAATAAKAASMSGYAATANRYVMIVMTAANTSATALTMNINGTGAKPIYINGSASSDSNYTLPAGSYLVFYDGTNYHFRTDGYTTSKHYNESPSSEVTRYPLTTSVTGVGLSDIINTNTRYWIKNGTTSAVGYNYLGLGNATASGTANNSQGYIRLYGPSSGYANLTYVSSTSNVTATIPAVGGHILVGSGTNISGKVTVSTSAPSGGADGDIWFVYTA